MVATRVHSVEQWEDLCSRAFAPLRVSAAPTPFASKIDLRVMEGVSLARVTSGGGGEIARTAALVDSAPADVALFSFQLRGSGTVSQSASSATVMPGTGVLYLADAPYTLAFGRGTDLMIVRAAVSDLGLPRSTLAGMAARPVRVRDDRALSMLARVAGSHLQDRALVESASETARLCVQLIGSALRGQAGLARPPRSRKELAVALRAEIDHRIEQNDLDAHTLARAQSISVRTVYAVFADVGTTPGREIRRARLRRARRLLVATRLRVVDIAVACGFDDTTTFTRAFGREFGQTPRDFRASPSPIDPDQAARSKPIA